MLVLAVVVMVPAVQKEIYNAVGGGAVRAGGAVDSGGVGRVVLAVVLVVLRCWRCCFRGVGKACNPCAINF